MQPLFAWQTQLFCMHDRDAAFPYEVLIRMRRERRGGMRGRVRWMRPDAELAPMAGESPALPAAQNDIHSVSRWMLPLGLPAYLQLRWFSGVGREPRRAGGVCRRVTQRPARN